VEGLSPLTDGKQGQKKFLESFTLCNGELVQLNSHYISFQNADDGASRDNRLHFRGQLDTYAHGCTPREGTAGPYEKSAQTDVNRFAFDDFRAGTEFDLGLKGNASGAATTIVDGSLGGADELQQSFFVDGL